jgi:hypothetical protein
MKVTVLGIALLISAVSVSDQISIAGDWKCRKSSAKHDAFTLEAEEIFEFSSEGWYISNAGFQARFSNGGSFGTSLNIRGLWSIDGGFLVREMAQVLVSSWDPSTSPAQDDEVATLLKSEYETGRSIRNEVRWSDENRMELLGVTGVVDFACEKPERQSREVNNVASAA